jgi:hypothetical protein
VARPDRPPGPAREGGPDASPDRPRDVNPPPSQRQEFSAASVPRSADSGPERDAAGLKSQGASEGRGRRPADSGSNNLLTPGAPPGLAALLALSDERDLWLRRVLDAWREGRESVNGSYPDGYDFGFDHGYGARQDARAFVRGIIDGYGEGLAERHRMLEEIRGRDRVKHLARKAAAQ